MTVTLPFGVNFRATAGFVTDVAPDVYEIGLTANYTSARGYGWETIPNTPGSRDRNAALNPELAGIAFCANGASPNVYRIDVPAGMYAIRLANGDTGDEPTQSCAIYDGTTLLKTVSNNVDSPANEWYDATGVLRNSAANWISNNTALIATISTGILRVYLGGSGVSGNATLAHIDITSIFAQGINFRATAAYVTDGPTEDYEILATSTPNYPRTTRQGHTVGWEVISNGPLATRDRSTSVDVRIAGVVDCSNANANTNNYRIDLPSPGQYIITLASGDIFLGTSNIELFDGTTSLGKLVNNGSALANHWFDATGVLRSSAADWAANNAQLTATFTTTICRLKIGGGSSGSSTPLAHIKVTATTSSGSTFAAAQVKMISFPSGPLSKRVLLFNGMLWNWRGQTLAGAVVGAAGRILRLGRAILSTIGSPGGLGP